MAAAVESALLSAANDLNNSHSQGVLTRTRKRERIMKVLNTLAQIQFWGLLMCSNLKPKIYFYFFPVHDIIESARFSVLILSCSK